MARVDIHNLSYSYPNAEQPALRGLDLTVGAGEWLLVQGPSGSGKSTLLKCITGACPAFYGGHIEGSVHVNHRDLSTMPAYERVKMVGFVGQDPEAQAVYTAVDREVAFALENTAVAPRDMGWRVAEVLDLVGMAGYAKAPLTELSGGQRQRVALAAALVHQPRLLVLDEPTSQLDPIAAEEWFDILSRLNREFGITLVMSEHRLDRAYQHVDNVLYMAGGERRQWGPPGDIAAWLCRERPEEAPPLARLVPQEKTRPLSVRDAQQILQRVWPVRDHNAGPVAQGDPQNTSVDFAAQPQRAGSRAREAKSPSPVPAHTTAVAEQRTQEATLVGFRDVVVYYGDAGAPALDECTCDIRRGRVTAVIGSNGAGKSTLLRVLVGLQEAAQGRFVGEWTVGAGKRKRGPIALGDPRIAYIPQNPNDYLSRDRVREELEVSLALRRQGHAARSQPVAELAAAFHLEHLMDANPRELSGGEKLRVAVASAASAKPELFVLDEPTRGLDAGSKRRFGGWLRAQASTVVLATHDMEFVAEFADDVLFVHEGRVVMTGPPRQVFGHALYFAPPIARALRPFDNNLLCLSDAMKAGWAL